METEIYLFSNLQMVENYLEEVLILEDDVRFEKFFIQKLQTLMNDIHHLNFTWDLVYVMMYFFHKSSVLLTRYSNI